MSFVIEQLEQLDDPREPNKIDYPLSLILFMSICAIFSGAEGWEDIVTWSESRIDWLSQYVDMSKGVPSDGTFRRALMLWGELMQSTILHHHPDRKSEDHIAVDGKTLRGSQCKAKELKAFQLVHAWSVENNIILGEVKPSSKTNEITAIPLLLELLDLEDSTISIDAIGCNDKIIKAIVSQQAHYMIALNKNQPKLYAAVDEYIQSNIQGNHMLQDNVDKSHGRSARRRLFCIRSS